MTRVPVDQARIPRGQRYHLYSSATFCRLDPRLTPKAHAKDPTQVQHGPWPTTRVRNYDLVEQWDWKRRIANQGVTSLQAWRTSKPIPDQRFPLQVQNTPHTVRLVAANVPMLLIPRNRYRFTWEISNAVPSAAGVKIYWSKGFPLQLSPGNFMGIPLGDDGYHMEQGNTIAIDDIWVFLRAGGVSSRVVGFEGTIAPEANLL